MEVDIHDIMPKSGFATTGFEPSAKSAEVTGGAGLGATMASSQWSEKPVNGLINDFLSNNNEWFRLKLMLPKMVCFVTYRVADF